MVNLEYLIIFKKDGIPIYSRCFGHFCGVLMRDNVILSGFLAALTAVGKDHLGESIQFEGKEMKLEFSKDGNLNNLIVGDTRLYFFYVQIDDYYIAAGFPATSFDTTDEKSFQIVDNLLEKISVFLNKNYKDQNWQIISNNDFMIFENKFLTDTIYPWMKKYKSSHTCMMGKNCALRAAMQQSKGETLIEKIRETIINYRKKSMFSKMMMMMSGIKEKMRSI